MAEGRSIARDVMVGLVTSAVGFAGAWYLQKQSRDADVKAEQVAAVAMLETQKKEHEQALEKERTLRAETTTMALFGEWQSPEVTKRTRLAAGAMSRVGAAGYAGLLANPSVSDAEKDAVNETLRFFARTRALAAAEELDVAKARELFESPARWWSTNAMPKLFAGTTGENATAPDGELVNAAYGLAALGGDVEPLSPPLDIQVVSNYVGMGPTGGGRSGAAAASTIAPMGRPVTTPAPHMRPATLPPPAPIPPPRG